jgi:hypothetical protein
MGFTEAQIKQVQRRIEARITLDYTEQSLHQESGIPQPTLNAVRRQGKLGYKTATRLAAYFGVPLEDLLNGTEPAGHYTSREEGLPVGYPKRGVVLDGLRKVVPREVLDDVQSMVLPPEAEWTELDWLNVVTQKANQWNLQRKPPDPSGGPVSHVGGQRRKAS